MSDDKRLNQKPEEQLSQRALDYHAYPTAGKIGIALTKPADSDADPLWLIVQV